ncbi:MAG: transcriptional regulator [Bdellovibrionales bacterium CG10_big_fil_rev_8_21_14_0_10_45_34]|nr:MAG: transcriptional regulator [Bdellovibrionales bacterium CG10_big_fil_rev_8_21_14_0_10_45_34]
MKPLNPTKPTNTVKRNDIDCSQCSAQNESVFCELREKDYIDLSFGKNTNFYKKGQTLFLEGNPPFGLFCVSSGKVKLTKASAEGKETIVRIAKPGDLLGHRSLFVDSPYSASATVIEDAQVCFISKSTITKLFAENPTFCMNVIDRLSQQMGEAESRLASLAQKSVRERFSEFLLLMKETYGESVDGKIKISLHLTREEMASIVGAATENLIRLISEFKSEGLVEEKNKTLFLLNVPKIEEYANLT